MSNLTLCQFLKEALLVPTPELRPGQHFSNLLYLRRPDLSVDMSIAGLDPFYRDDLIWSAVEFLKKTW